MIQDPRRALQVTRYHTWPRLREQSVGEHSMQVMRILLAIWPDCSRELLMHCLVHDIGETVSGDPPYPVKRDNPVLKAECDRIERSAHLSMCIPWGLPAPQALTEVERAVFKLAEFIEMWEWGLHEIRLGNDYAVLVRDRCREAMDRILSSGGMVCEKLARNYIKRREHADGKRQAEVSSAPGRHRSNGRVAGEGEGQELRSELEEARGDLRIRDAGAQVGSSGGDPGDAANADEGRSLEDRG